MNQTQSKYKWTKVHSTHDGHTFWRDENTGRISVKDQSGPTPESTDDGVLWVDFNRPFRLGQKYVTIPLLRQSAESGTIETGTLETPARGIESAIALKARLIIEGNFFDSLNVVIPAVGTKEGLELNFAQL